MKQTFKVLALATGIALTGVVHAQAVDYDVTSRIRTEALQNSQVMKTMNHLTDVIGPRLTNSPSMAAANTWAKEQFTQWGISNVHDEAVDDFGRGWVFTEASFEMTTPRAMPLHALPKAWTPGTNGVVSGDAIIAKLQSKADLEKFKGKLRGKVVFLDDLRPYKPNEKSDFQRYDKASLEELASSPVPVAAPKPAESPEEMMKKFRERIAFTPALNQFLIDEGVVATVSISSWNDGIVRVMGAGSRKAGESVGVPSFVMASEHYNTVMRAMDRNEKVNLRLSSNARFTDDTNKPAFNTIAEIPGTGPNKNEIVMIGAHLDSWHTGSGASDNGAGVAVMMEAMRILKAVGAKPNRTIRVGLWAGEEQGLVGSQAYVAKHFAKYPEPADPEERKIPLSLRKDKGKLERTGDFDKFSVYFNLDNGSGKIRGVYAQENLASAPIFENWLKPFNDLGATLVTQRNTGSTDHISFDQVGLPGFQFVQDGLDYFSHVHHTSLDVQDHVSEPDLKQASAIVASFAYNAAMMKDKFPRKKFVEKK